MFGLTSFFLSDVLHINLEGVLDANIHGWNLCRESITLDGENLMKKPYKFVLSARRIESDSSLSLTVILPLFAQSPSNKIK